MKKEIADKWVAALRSGEYTQGRQFLHNRKENSYCCLGVLCKIAQNDKVKLNEKSERVTQYHFTSFDGYEDFLPSKVQKYAEMRTSDGFIQDLDFSLADMNDGNRRDPCTFDEIADFIEENWERL